MTAAVKPAATAIPTIIGIVRAKSLAAAPGIIKYPITSNTPTAELATTTTAAIAALRAASIRVTLVCCATMKFRSNATATCFRHVTSNITSAAVLNTAV